MKSLVLVLAILCAGVIARGALAITLGITQSSDFSGSIGVSSVIGGQAIDGGESQFATLGDGAQILEVYRPRSVAEFILDTLAAERLLNATDSFCGNLPLLEIGVGCDFTDDEGARRVFRLFDETR